MRRVLAAAAAVSLLAGGAPALAAAKAKSAPKHAACKAPAGAIVVKPGKPATTNPATPVGVLNASEEMVGDVYVDLAGKPLTSKASLNLQLGWDNPVSDYDMIVDGSNELASDNPEFVDVTVKHCRPVTVAVGVFYGAPIDTLTFTATATAK